ncbi:protein-disulfide reductase DsbD [Leeia sp. TBRC 13508]|uniref:Protein-disulfide reductase DsbD n=1 Tax=Leeia speluncae TaxID=2884804 RepID=A0ABS8D472_9NEIS|nr:protein-disulfide reductase DsbD [Leeia speluncae]MCB6182992.1 protein-disulfide reductase DsbD [Leeia speluncae]
MNRLLRSFFVFVLLLISTASFAESLIRAREAFVPTARTGAPGNIIVRYEVTSGYYLYKDRFKFLLDGQAIANVQVPNGDLKNDPVFGNVLVFHKGFDIQLPIPKPNKIASLSIQSQGCSEKFKVCFPPETHVFKLKPDGTIENPSPPKSSNSSSWKNLFSQTNAADSAAFSAFSQPIAFTLGGFFLAGLLMAGTMCMYPLIPIISALIAGDPKAQAGHRARSFLLSLSYVQGLALSYTVAGLIAASLGLQLTLWLQNPWVIGSFAGLMVIFAVAMFGLFEIQLPSGFQTRFTNLANKLPGGHMTSVFVMGLLSALIIGPCATPALAAALLFIAKTGNLWTGGLSLYVMALGVGFPLLLIGLLGQHAIPKAGPWMKQVRQVFGVLLLFVSLWMARPLLSTAWLMGLLGALLILSAVFLSALDTLPSKTSMVRKVWKGVGVILLIAGAAYLVGAFAGSNNFSKPLAGLAGTTDSVNSSVNDKLNFQPVRSVAELKAAITNAKGKTVLLDFYADWCVSCIEMEREVFSQVKVKQGLANTVLLRADVTNNTEGDRALLAAFDLFGPPGIILFNKAGMPSTTPIIGYIEAEGLLNAVAEANR